MAEEEKAKADAEAAKITADMEADNDDDSDKSSDEERPVGIVQPKYKIVHSYPADMMDAWEGH